MPIFPNTYREIAVWRSHEDHPHPPALRTMSAFMPKKRLPPPDLDIQGRILFQHLERAPFADGLYFARYWDLPEQEPVRFLVDRGTLTFLPPTTNTKFKENIMSKETIVLNNKTYIEVGGDEDGILVPGKNVFIRTVTYHHVGRVVSVSETEVRLEHSSWVADSGRWHTALETGALSEVEFSGEAGVSRGAIVDYFPWKHALPATSK
jgi:hypothetical protein